jgi:hypothetical protein
MNQREQVAVNKISTRHHIPEDGILHSHRRENLKSYKPRSILAEYVARREIR